MRDHLGGESKATIAYLSGRCVPTLGQNLLQRTQRHMTFSRQRRRIEVRVSEPLLDLLEDPGGDRVVVTIDGKFLPYQW